jgi:hypothetical protein
MKGRHRVRPLHKQRRGDLYGRPHKGNKASALPAISENPLPIGERVGPARAVARATARGEGGKASALLLQGWIRVKEPA